MRGQVLGWLCGLGADVGLPQGHFIVWEGAPGARMPWKGHHRHVFLFRHHLVVCKPRRDSRTDTFSYVFRNMMKVGWREGREDCGGAGPSVGQGQAQRPAFLQTLSLHPPTPQLSSIDLNDQVEGDDRAFEIWHEREDSVRKYLLQARTVITKNAWVKEICGIQQRLALPVWRECPTLGRPGGPGQEHPAWSREAGGRGSVWSTVCSASQQPELGC